MNSQIAGLGRRSAYALLNLFTGLGSLVFLPVLLLCVLLCLLGIGLVLLPAALRALHAWAAWHQGAAARLLGQATPEQHSFQKAVAGAYFVVGSTISGPGEKCAGLSCKQSSASSSAC